MKLLFDLLLKLFSLILFSCFIICCNNLNNKTHKTENYNTIIKKNSLSLIEQDSLEKLKLVTAFQNDFIESGFSYFFKNLDSFNLKTYLFKDSFNSVKLYTFEFYKKTAKLDFVTFNRDSIYNLKKIIWNRLVPKIKKNCLTIIHFQDRKIVNNKEKLNYILGNI